MEWGKDVNLALSKIVIKGNEAMTINYLNIKNASLMKTIVLA